MIGQEYPEKVWYLESYTKFVWKINRFLHDWLKLDTRGSVLYMYHKALTRIIDWTSIQLLKLINNKYILNWWKIYIRKSKLDWNWIYKTELRSKRFKWLLLKKRKKKVRKKQFNLITFRAKLNIINKKNKYKLHANDLYISKFKFYVINYFIKGIFTCIAFLSFIYEYTIEYINDFFLFNNQNIQNIVEFMCSFF
jgi:hypothetical protein